MSKYKDWNIIKRKKLIPIDYHEEINGQLYGVQFLYEVSSKKGFLRCDFRSLQEAERYIDREEEIRKDKKEVKEDPTRE